MDLCGFSVRVESLVCVESLLVYVKSVVVCVCVEHVVALKRYDEGGDRSGGEC